MKRTIIAIMLALVLVLIPVVSAMAASSKDVTVTATPTKLSIKNTPDTWLINGLPDGVAGGEASTIEPDTWYYSNPQDNADDIVAPSATVVDGECWFTVTNKSVCIIDLTVNWGDFSGGGANMTNGETGANGATSYGGYIWYSGMTYATDKIIAKKAGSDVYKNVGDAGLAKDASLMWGAEIQTQQNAFLNETPSTSTMTITATEHV